MNEKEYLNSSRKTSKMNVNTLQKSILSNASAIGRYTELIVQYLWESESYKIYSKLNRFLKIAKNCTNAVFEAACKRANYYGCYSIKTVENVIDLQLYLLPLSIKSDIYGQMFLFDD